MMLVLFRSIWFFLAFSLAGLAISLTVIRYLLIKLTDARSMGAQAKEAAEAEAAKAKVAFDAEVQAFRANSQKYITELMAKAEAEENRIRQFLEAEAKKAQAEVEHLRQYQNLEDASAAAKELIVEAESLATKLKAEAELLLTAAKFDAQGQRADAARKVEELRKDAEARLSYSITESKRLIEAAEKEAKKVGGDAYIALREKEHLDEAIIAIRNIIEGYGDRYVIPTRSIIDDLAENFEHTDAGAALKRAREQSRIMVDSGAAADCDYVEANRRSTAIRFVIDAFNGRVDGILSRTKLENYGTLEREVRDAFTLVNLNGEAFKNAKILPAYLDSRIQELRWAVSVHALRMQEREEQRRIQEQIREEERARIEYERAIKEASRDQETLTKALEKARQEIAAATEAEKAKFERQIEDLTNKLNEAAARSQRALSMAQQTKAGHVYVISNVGSFGDDVFKIGLTRRLEPEERVWELSNASVPFEYDIHAMIYSDNAPELEHQLHKSFADERMNMVNSRKEFFRVPLTKIRELVTAQNLKASFTMVAAAREYRESKALAAMPESDRVKYLESRPRRGMTSDLS